jgi:Cof subfamily protein (haloacid dehalogenase superfamily)
VRRDIRLVIADVDGTLVTQSKVLTPRAIEAVRRLHETGIAFSITSGRPPRGMRMLIEPLAMTEPVAGFNGGVLVHPDMTVIEQNFLPADVAEGVIASLVQQGIDCWLYTDRDWLLRDAEAPHVAREQWTVQFAPKVVQDFSDAMARAVKIVGVSDDIAKLARCEADLQRDCAGRASVARSQPYYLDITHPDANKGHVVVVMSKLLSIPTANIATIGDMPNDVLMFRQSGFSIAMENASPEVKQQAQFVTASNEEEGFAEAMEKCVLAER